MAIHFPRLQETDNAPNAVPPKDRGVDYLVSIFDRLFAVTDRTRLESGAAEPLYRPAAAAGDYHRVIFTRDYFASALHEVAHWCIAGPVRRRQLDYGYWYVPDGRDVAQQARFEQVEVKPQALEWIFSRAARRPFRVSADNLDIGAGPSTVFRERIWRQARAYCRRGLPERAALFAAALAEHFGGRDYLDAASYRGEDL